MARRIAWFLAVMVALAPVSARAAKPAVVEKAGEGIYVVSDPKLTSTNFTMVVKAGCSDEPGGVCRGLAHYLEHLILSGRDGQHGEVAIRMFPGAYSNGWTNSTATAYVHRVPVRQPGDTADLEKLFGFYASRLKTLGVGEAEAERERNVVMQEYNQRIGNSAEGRFRARYGELLVPGWPRGQPVIGWPHAIAGLSLADATAFHDSWYRRANVAVIVSTPLPVADVAAIAQKTFGEVPDRPVPPRPGRLAAPALDTVRLVTDDPTVQETTLLYTRVVPYTPSDRKAWRATRAILVDYLQSRLDGSVASALVEEQALAPAIGVDVFRPAPGHAAIQFRISVPAGADPETTVTALDTYVTELGKRGLTQETVDRLKKRRLDRVALNQLDARRVAEELIDWIADRDTLEDMIRWPERLGAVAPVEVNAFAAHLSSPARRVIGILRKGAKP